MRIVIYSLITLSPPKAETEENNAVVALTNSKIEIKVPGKICLEDLQMHCPTVGVMDILRGNVCLRMRESK